MAMAPSYTIPQNPMFIFFSQYHSFVTLHYCYRILLILKSPPRVTLCTTIEDNQVGRSKSKTTALIFSTGYCCHDSLRCIPILRIIINLSIKSLFQFCVGPASSKNRSKKTNLLIVYPQSWSRPSTESGAKN